MKKLLLLGGGWALRPVIAEAHRQGLYVITCDNVPGNVAHTLSDEYWNASIVEQGAILDLAHRHSVDGIMSFATDPGVVSAAYVAEQMGLPCAVSYAGAQVLQRKDTFRAFLLAHGFNVPQVGAYARYEDALEDFGRFRLPVMVKPVDSAGSKGVSRVDSIEDFYGVFRLAKSQSFAGRVIVEEYVDTVGYPSDSDCFVVDGQLAFASFSSQLFDKGAANPFAPCGFVWPSVLAKEEEESLCVELQRLFTILEVGTGLFNVEARIGVDGRVYLMEVSPRGGGNCIPEILEQATGVPLIGLSIRAAMGEHVVVDRKWGYEGVWGEVIPHAGRAGELASVRVGEPFRSQVVREAIWRGVGSAVEAFSGANAALGSIVFRFDSVEAAHAAMEQMEAMVELEVV